MKTLRSQIVLSTLLSLPLSIVCSLNISSAPSLLTISDAQAQPATQSVRDDDFIRGAISYRSSRRIARSSYRRSYRRSSSRRVSRGSSYRRRTVVRHRGSRPVVDSSQPRVMTDFILEFGGALFSPLQGNIVSGLQLAVGSRLGPVAGVIETQITQGEMGAKLSDLNAQLRVYLPLGHNTEIYPLVAVGQANLLGDLSSSHLDLGLGAQFNISENFGVGARYSARLISELVNGVPTNGHNLTAQMAFTF